MKKPIIKKILSENESRIRKNLMLKNKFLFLRYFLGFQSGLYFVSVYIIGSWNPIAWNENQRGFYAFFFVGLLFYVWGSYIRATNVIDFEINKLKTDE